MRIWDNIFAYGTRFLIMASLAILKQSEADLIILDMDDTIQYFDRFRGEEDSGGSSTGSCEILRPYEEIIAEAIRIGNKIATPARVQQIFD